VLEGEANLEETSLSLHCIPSSSVNRLEHLENIVRGVEMMLPFNIDLHWLISAELSTASTGE
jgi:hypothetical protein